MKTRVLPSRRIHLGIDYGTSTSKIVFRDYGAPGGERAVLILSRGSIRIPSTVGLREGMLQFGGTEDSHSGTILYESLKMRAAMEATGDPKYFYGTTTPLPDGFSACDLAVLTVWYLISEGHRAVLLDLSGNAAGLRLGMTMGVPMAFFDDVVLQPLFLSIARQAWQLYREEDLLEVSLPLEKARHILDLYPRTRLPEISDDEVRDWLRSEGEAAMWWPFQSPAVGPGPYAKIDIGAGTTHASLYRIHGDNLTPKTGIAFFGASTISVGMDGIDNAISICIGEKGDCRLLRGREQEILRRNSAARDAIEPLREEMYQTYRRAWGQTLRKIGDYQAERQAWGAHKIFMIGGGSLVPIIADSLRVHPAGGNLTIQLMELEPPPDLKRADNRAITAAQLPFASVAYGLANIGLSIPEALTPNQVDPMPLNQARRERLNWDDIYAK